MDRARLAGASGPRRGWWTGGSDTGRANGKGEPLSRTVVPPLLALATLFACKFTIDPDQPVAIEVILPDSSRVEVTDMVRPRARALNGLGDSIAAQVSWSSLDTALVVLDSATGVSLAKAVGTARLQARTGALRSNPQNVFVLPPLDSVRVDGAVRDTVTLAQADSLSDSLRVKVFAPAQGTEPLRSRRVVYAATIFPAAGATVTFVPLDTVKTNTAGIALAQLRLVPGPVPDSVRVSATVRRFDGTLVPDSVKFVVEFRP